MKNTSKLPPVISLQDLYYKACVSSTTLEQAFRSCRATWFAAGQPMDRATSPLRRRYVRLYNLMATRKLREQGFIN